MVRTRTMCAAAIGLMVAMSGLVGCAPVVPAPTQIRVVTVQTWCGGVIPPPGEPWCHTSNVSRTVELRSGREPGIQITTGSDGSAVVDVSAGTYRVTAVDAPAYEQCDAAMVVAVDATVVSVEQTCSIFAP